MEGTILPLTHQDWKGEEGGGGGRLHVGSSPSDLDSLTASQGTGSPFLVGEGSEGVEDGGEGEGDGSGDHGEGEPGGRTPHDNGKDEIENGAQVVILEPTDKAIKARTCGATLDHQGYLD